MYRKILYLSMNYPDKEACDAGTRSFAYYFHELAKDKDNEIKLISLVYEKRYEVSYDNVELFPVKNEDKAFKRFIGYLRSIRSKIDPNYKYGNLLSWEKYRIIETHLKKLYESGYRPDAVVFEWTYLLLFIDTVKKYFPEARYIASEQDVTFQAMEREYQNKRSRYNLLRYKSIRRNELYCLESCDLIFVYDEKDKRLLKDNGITSMITVLSPYYDKRENLYKQGNNCILFYGAMSRKENYTAAIWFIEQVMPLLKDYNVSFVAAGNNPPKKLIEYIGKKVIVTGYVKDISEYYSKALCFVAPLLYGAGIKVKILEAMSAGIPVLTNDVGIEGIENVAYFHCESPEDYADAITGILKGSIDCNELSRQARDNVHSLFNYEQSAGEYCRNIYGLIS